MESWALRKFPELHSFAKDKLITVKEAKLNINDRLQNLFFLPLSMIAFDQSNELKEMLNNIQNDGDKDLWKFPWNSPGYSTRKVYLELNKYPKALVIFKWIWKSPCLPKHKLFFWLMIQDKINTRDMLTRKNFMSNQQIVFCVMNLC